MNDVILPPQRHEHIVGYPEGLPRNALIRCSSCGQWLHTVYQYSGFGGDYVWRPVRWYHLRLRRRIRNHPYTTKSRYTLGRINITNKGAR